MWRGEEQSSQPISTPALRELFFLRHGLRLDQIDHSWRSNSPTPYDTPIARQGYAQSFFTGQAILQHSATQKRPRFVIHSSPFLRCIQTSLALAAALSTDVKMKPILRIDSSLGEWLTPDYYNDIPAPPSMLELAQSALYYLTQLSRTPRTSAKEFGPTWKEVLPLDSKVVDVDWDWDSELFGSGGEYGEEWPEMHSRFRSSLRKTVAYYSKAPSDRIGRTSFCTRGDEILILVSHGAGCNAMIGAVTGRPVLKDVGLAALSHAVAIDSSLASQRPSSPSRNQQYNNYSVPRAMRNKISDSYCLLMSASVDHLIILDPASRSNTHTKDIGRSGSWHNSVGRSVSASATPTSPSGLWTSPVRSPNPSRPLSSIAPIPSTPPLSYGGVTAGGTSGCESVVKSATRPEMTKNRQRSSSCVTPYDLAQLTTMPIHDNS